MVLATRNAGARQQLADDIHGRGGRAYALASDVQDEAAHALWPAL